MSTPFTKSMGCRAHPTWFTNIAEQFWFKHLSIPLAMQCDLFSLDRSWLPLDRAHARYYSSHAPNWSLIPLPKIPPSERDVPIPKKLLGHSEFKALCASRAVRWMCTVYSVQTLDSHRISAVHCVQCRCAGDSQKLALPKIICWRFCSFSFCSNIFMKHSLLSKYFLSD